MSDDRPPTEPPEEPPEHGFVPPLGPIDRLSRDLRDAAVTLSDAEARFIVDAYYIIQEDRKRSFNQLRDLVKNDEPHGLLLWFADSNKMLEGQLKSALDRYSASKPIGVWARSIHGIGPVIAAGLIAHIDIKKAKTAGAIWSFAGLNDEMAWLGGKKATEMLSKVAREAQEDAVATSARSLIDSGRDIGPPEIMMIAKRVGCSPKWLSRRVVRAVEGEDIAFRGLHQMEDLDYVTSMLAGHEAKGKHLIKALSKRPWNASLKTLCWKIGQSFMKFHAAPECYYGHIYVQRKAYEVARNDRMGNRELSVRILSEKNFKKTTEAYKHLSEGKLPPGQIDARARRYAVKLFLSHLHEKWYELEFGTKPPNPYPISFLGHAHKIDPPE